MRKLLMLGGAVAVMMTGASQMALADTDDLTVEAYIVETLVLDCTIQSLDFGNLDAGLPGVVTMTTAGIRSSTEASNLVPVGTSNEGTCSLVGEPGFDVEITTTAAFVDLTGPGPETLTVNNFTFNDAVPTGEGPAPYATVLDGSGAGTISVGADLTIAGGETPGAYTGTFEIVALYD